MSLPRAHFRHNPRILPHLFLCGIPIEIFMKVIEAKERQGRYLREMFPWLAQVHPTQQVVEARVVAEPHHLAALSSGRTFSMTQVWEPKSRPAVKAMRCPSG